MLQPVGVVGAPLTSLASCSADAIFGSPEHNTCCHSERTAASDLLGCVFACNRPHGSTKELWFLGNVDASCISLVQAVDA
jgi:hypothetical protein